MSFVALQVKKIAKGVKINEDIQAPNKGFNPFSCEIRLPKVLMKWKVININTAKTMGNPKPPFLIIAPKGAPIKNNSKQETALTSKTLWKKHKFLLDNGLQILQKIGNEEFNDFNSTVFWNSSAYISNAGLQLGISG